MKKLELIGIRFNRLIVISEAPVRLQKTYWNCLCDCGNKCKVWGSALKTGQTQSCGCLQKQRLSESVFKHGISNKTPEYRAWVNMKTRCYREIGNDYKDYGARGIRVCDRWLNSFVNFLADMGKKPSKLHSIERNNTDGDYEPNNCCWAIEDVQVRNKRNNVWIEYKGERKILTDWARYFGVDQGNLAASLRVKSMETVYNYYLNKYGKLPCEKEYIPPCKINTPINIRKRLSSQLLAELDKIS